MSYSFVIYFVNSAWGYFKDRILLSASILGFVYLFWPNLYVALLLKYHSDWDVALFIFLMTVGLYTLKPCTRVLLGGMTALSSPNAHGVNKTLTKDVNQKRKLTGAFAKALGLILLTVVTCSMVIIMAAAQFNSKLDTGLVVSLKDDLNTSKEQINTLNMKLTGTIADIEQLRVELDALKKRSRSD